MNTPKRPTDAELEKLLRDALDRSQHRTAIAQVRALESAARAAADALSQPVKWACACGEPNAEGMHGIHMCKSKVGKPPLSPSPGGTDAP